MKRRPTLRAVYARLLRCYGPQHWWPAQTAFEMMVGAVLTQNAAWTNVERAIENLRAQQLLDPRRILETRPARLAACLKPSGYFNVKARRLRAFCRWLVNAGGEQRCRRLHTHRLRDELLAVHGVGPETADDVLLYAFQRPVFVIDSYTRRIFGRLGLVKPDAGYETLRVFFETDLPPSVEMYNEFHALIVRHGKEICRSRPHCLQCCLAGSCAFPQQDGYTMHGAG